MDKTIADRLAKARHVVSTPGAYPESILALSWQILRKYGHKQTPVSPTQSTVKQDDEVHEAKIMLIYSVIIDGLNAEKTANLGDKALALARVVASLRDTLEAVGEQEIAEQFNLRFFKLLEFHKNNRPECSTKGDPQ